MHPAVSYLHARLVDGSAVLSYFEHGLQLSQCLVTLYNSSVQCIMHLVFVVLGALQQSMMSMPPFETSSHEQPNNEP